MTLRFPWIFGLLVALLLSLQGCARQPLHVLDGPPGAAFDTLGMLSAQGENEASAMEHMVDQAEGLQADAVIIVGRKQVGRVVIITARAIRYKYRR